jgi:indoleamine 2,3-dioxygenase
MPFWQPDGTETGLLA